MFVIIQDMTYIEQFSNESQKKVGLLRLGQEWEKSETSVKQGWDNSETSVILATARLASVI